MVYENFPAYSTADNHLSLIKAATAYARGATGAGETVVVVDSGIDASHREFAGGKVEIVTGIGDSCSPSDAARGRCAGSAHGTAVASVVAGHRGSSSSGTDMHGVAFDAQIKFIPITLRGSSSTLPPVLSLNEYTFQPTDIEVFDNADDFRQYIAEGEILNYSFGAPWALSEWRTLGGNCGAISETGPYACYRHYYRPNMNALAQTVTNPADRSIIVIAAGNAYDDRHDRDSNGDSLGLEIDASSPSADGALAIAFNRPGDPNLDHVIAVVAVGADGSIASYSNRCGQAKAFCIAAPGGDRDDDRILAAKAGGGYEARSGTSFAAPIVSGSLALLRQYFRGQLGNTELVTRLLTTANREGRYANSDIYGHGLVNLDTATAPVGRLMTGLPGDSGSRAFAGSGIALSGSAFGSSLQRQLADVEVAAFDSLGAPFFQSAAAWVTQPAQQRGSGIYREQRELSLAAAPYQNNTATLSLGFNGNGVLSDARFSFADGWWFSYGDHGARRFSDPLAFAAPYLSLVRNGPGIGWSHSRAGGGSFGFALMHGAPQFDGQQNPGRKRGIGALLDLTLNGGLSLQAGAVREADGFLGARPQGALGQARGATAFIGVNGAWVLSDNWRVLTSAYLGRTRPQVDDTGLLHDAGAILSSAFSIGAVRASLWRPGDWFGMRLSQPLRVEKGRMKLRLPIGRTKYGEVVQANHRVNLAPAGRNLQLETTYHLPFAGGALKTSVGAEHHPQHDRASGIRPFMRLSFEKYF